MSEQTKCEHCSDEGVIGVESYNPYCEEFVTQYFDCPYCTVKESEYSE